MANLSFTKDSSLCAGFSQLPLRETLGISLPAGREGNNQTELARPCRCRGEDQKAEVSLAFFGKLLTQEPTGFVMFRGGISNVLTGLSKL